MKYGSLMLVPLALMLSVPMPLSADAPQPLAQVDQIIEMATAHGFVSFREIETKDGDRVEVDGWLESGWHAEAEFALADGSLRKEERERRSAGSSMSADDVRQAVAVAASEGMTDFHEIELGRTGFIEVEGRDERGRELEIRVRLSDHQLVRVERD